VAGVVFVYPADPAELGETARRAVDAVGSSLHRETPSFWPDPGQAGAFMDAPILQQIEECDYLAADLTGLTFNISYQIGYAIGRGKPMLTTKNAAFKADDQLAREVGLFGTFTQREYQNAQQLAAILTSAADATKFAIPAAKVNQKAPVYVLLPKTKTDLEVHLISRVKKARLFFRTFDPEEQGRLSVYEAVKNVAASYGVIMPFLPNSRKDAESHNLRAAFLAGLATAMEKEVLLLQFGKTPVPQEYGDLVRRTTTAPQINAQIAEFAPAITDKLQSDFRPVIVGPGTFLAKINLGATAAENEMADLEEYYLETDEYRRAALGEAQIVAGRKGSGKTALFVKLRNNLRRNRQTVVLDLKPEGFQLIKFKDIVLTYLEQGTREHTVMAFWEYLLLLEICHKILENDKELHITNHRLTDQYRAMSAQYKADTYVSEGDFAERMLKLTERIIDEFKEAIGIGDRQTRLSGGEITDILYKHDVKGLRKTIQSYLEHKRAVWILFDNIDKGWPARGLESEDVLILRCLINAVAKMEKYLRKENTDCHGIVFLRNDVYELLVDNTADRGKTSRVTLDWTDPDLLREMLRRRLVANGLKPTELFEAVWPMVCVSHIDGVESSDYLIDRCLMRPRSLLDLLYQCRSHAVNLGHARIEVKDIKQGEATYSSDMVANVGFEIRDVFPAAIDFLYEFIGANAHVTLEQLNGFFESGKIPEDQRPKLLDLLLWYGFFGIVREEGEIAYIYSVKYDIKRLKALVKKQQENIVLYYINPAFWAGLEIVSTL
jgi:hypothetical protein